MRESIRFRSGIRGRLVVAAVALAALALPGLALAHLERPSYWPDPRPDTSVKPPAGGLTEVSGRGSGQ